MNLIAAVDKEWGIGYQGKLLAHISSDLQWFKKLTHGKVVIYGRKTLDTFPNRKPLPFRVNIIISSDTSLQVDGATVVHSIDEALDAVSEYPSTDVFVIGGASIYKQMLPHCNCAYITHIDYSFKKDAFFPALEDGWTCVMDTRKFLSDDFDWPSKTPFSFHIYIRDPS